MSADATSGAARRAGRQLHELLLHEYRHRWLVRSERSRRDRVNALAVAKVVADHLDRFPSETRAYGTESAQIKDVIWRALNARALSRQTLQLIIEALGISERHAAMLWDQWNGTAVERVIVGSLPPLEGSTSPVQRFQTIQCHEFHYVGADGQPARHRTVQAIRALVDGYATHRYLFDTSEVTVRRVHGGLPGEAFPVSGQLWAVDIALPHVLKAGETASMEFVTEFHNRDRLEALFRYAAHQRVEDLILRVEFDPARLPTSILWTKWRDYREPITIVSQEPVTLDSEHAVARALDVLQRATVGFRWEF